MGKLIDLTGKHFERLLVLYRDYEYEKNHKGGTYWHCICDCGKEVTVSSAHLRSGHTQSCGCLRWDILAEKSKKTQEEKERQKEKRKEKYDLTGKRFGKWYVKDRDWAKKDNKDSYWICKCDCGIIKSVIGQSLRNGDSTSCGCNLHNIRYDLIQDRTGEIINEITILGLDMNYQKEHNLKRQCSYWKCQCSCGNVFTTAEDRLDRIISCGCKNSKAEYLIHQILNKYKIKYNYQYTFSDLRTDKEGIPRFDFGLLDNDENLKCLIEYNGKQHYEYSNSGWNTEEQVQRTRYLDNLKKEYCENNNIPLEIISYKDFDNLEQILTNIFLKYNLSKGE